MADLGIARMSKEMGLGGTLTRADLADVVHSRLGLSRANRLSSLSACFITCAIRCPKAGT